jgi:hypothetical protein
MPAAAVRGDAVKPRREAHYQDRHALRAPVHGESPWRYAARADGQGDGDALDRGDLVTIDCDGYRPGVRVKAGLL